MTQETIKQMGRVWEVFNPVFIPNSTNNFFIKIKCRNTLHSKFKSQSFDLFPLLLWAAKEGSVLCALFGLLFSKLSRSSLALISPFYLLRILWVWNPGRAESFYFMKNKMVFSSYPSIPCGINSSHSCH